jgi:hypothetical protein
MIGLLLSIVSSVLTWVFQPIAFVFGCIVALCKKEFGYYNQQLAIAKDRYGNVLCQYIFNAFLRKEKGYKFGNGKETISSVVGKNKKANTLTMIGKMLDAVLDKFEKNHSINSIDETIK